MCPCYTVQRVYLRGPKFCKIGGVAELANFNSEATHLAL